jgi:serine/threonine protein kinase
MIFPADASSVTIARSDVQKGRLIGTGSFGRVYEATWNCPTGENRGSHKVAIKEFVRDESNAQFGDTLKRELVVARSLAKTAKIIRPIGMLEAEQIQSESSQTTDAIVMELADLGSLQSRIESVRKGGAPLTEEQLAHMARSVLQVLGEAHSLGIVHRDIRPTNILFLSPENTERREESSTFCIPASDPFRKLLTDTSGLDFGDDLWTIKDLPDVTSMKSQKKGTQPEDVRLADFGIASLHELYQQQGRLVKSVANTILQAGGSRYTAPELVEPIDPAPSQDIYSFGIVFYEAAAGSYAFEQDKFHSELQMMHAVYKGHRPSMDALAGAPSWISQLITAAWQGDPSKRPSAQELLAMIPQPSHSVLLSNDEQIELVSAAQKRAATVKRLVAQKKEEMLRLVLSQTTSPQSHSGSSHTVSPRLSAMPSNSTSASPAQPAHEIADGSKSNVVGNNSSTDPRSSQQQQQQNMSLLSRVSAVFRDFDTDGDGAIAIAAVGPAVRKLNMDPTSQELLTTIDQVAGTRLTIVDLPTFVRIMLSLAMTDRS